MENQSIEENYLHDANANPNENADDEPCPPPGLSRLVTGQTYSFDDGLNSPPFDRVVPGDAEPYPTFTSGPKKTNYGNTFFNDNNAFSSSQDFFDSYLRNSSTPDSELIPNSNKHKFANQFFPSHDAEKRENFLQQDISRLPSNAFDGVNKNANIPFNNYKNRPLNPMHASKVPSKISENVQYNNSSQLLLPPTKMDNMQKFDHNIFSPHENDIVADNREKPTFFQQNNFPTNVEKDRRIDPKIQDSSSDRMAIEGSCDSAPYTKTMSSSTPLQSPNYDHWYSSKSANTFDEHQDVKSTYTDDLRLKRESNTSYGAKYGVEKSLNVQNVPPIPPNMQFAPSNVLQPPQDGVNAHSKTPSISSNTSSMNDPSVYQHENFASEQKRNDHFVNTEILEGGNSSTSFDIPSGVVSKQSTEKSTKNFENHHSDNDFLNDPKQLKNMDINRETFDNDDEEREIPRYTDSDEKPMGQRTVVGYHNNTIPRTRKTVERPLQDARTGKPFSYDTSHIKSGKMEPPLEQRMVVGETSSDATGVQKVSRLRDDRPYNDEKPRRNVQDAVGSRVEKSRKKLPFESRRDRRKIDSDDEDYDESLDRPYDDGPGLDPRSYHDKYYRESPRRFDKRLSRRHHDSSYTQSQDESYFDDDDDDDYNSYKSQRKYYDRRPPRETNYRSYYNDSYFREEIKYRRPAPDYYSRYEEDSFFGDRNSRPSSRSGSELFRPLPYPNHRYHPKVIGYEYLDHREILRYTGGPRMKKDEIEFWSNVREVDPQKYMNWFKNKFPKEYAEWYSHYFLNKMMPSNSYQNDRRGSGHSGQSSINNDTLNINEEKLHGMNEPSMFKSLESDTNSIVPETRCSPSKFTVPHVKGVFNSLGQLIEVNACSPQDGQVSRIDIKKILDPVDPDWIEFFNFTGPFIPGETHVHTVSQFLKYHADASTNISKKLLYLLIDLIIKLRGVADGISVSELLMASCGESQKSIISYEKEEDKQSSDCNMSETQIIENYTNLLLQGNKHSALELAVNNKLWGHAFLLASKMGTKYYSNVLAKFDASISTNNPLKTLYQLHSNQVPLAATACSDEKWGDWRPHLAMILSNPTSGNNLDKTSIITLGDSLIAKDVYAAHFCYLAAEMDFDPPHKSSSKFSLLSLRNNIDHFGINTSNHAILLTQIYEFAKRLQRKDYTISALLPYKYLLATRLLDYNRSSIALQYLESIALDLMNDANDENYNLMYNVLEISERIKYSDSKPLVSDAGDKQWLADLRHVVDKFSNKYPEQNSLEKFSRPDHAYPLQSLQPASVAQPLPSEIPLSATTSQLYTPLDEPQQPFMFQPSPVNQVPSSLPNPIQNSSWENASFPSNNVGISSSNGFIQTQPANSVDINDNISVPKSNDFNQPSNDNYQQNVYNPWDQPQQPISISMHSSNNYFKDSSKPTKSNDLHNVSKTNVQCNNSLKKHEMARNNMHYSHEKLYQLKRLKNKSLNLKNENPWSVLLSSRTKRFPNLRYKFSFGDDLSEHYFHSLSHSKIIFNGTFPIDRPFRIRDNLCNKKLQPTNENDHQNRKVENQAPVPASTQDNDKNMDKKQENNGSWLGLGFLNKFKRQNIHEAKLPEDKDPVFVYDKEKGRWVDKENKDDNNANSFKPPPSMHEFKNVQQTDNEPINRITTPFYDQSKSVAPPSSTRPGNAYSLSRGKGMKANYVNVLASNQSGARPTNMPPPPGFTPSQAPNMNMFVPPGQNNSTS